MSRIFQIAQSASSQEQVSEVLTGVSAVLTAVTLYLAIALNF